MSALEPKARQCLGTHYIIVATLAPLSVPQLSLPFGLGMSSFPRLPCLFADNHTDQV